MEKEGKVVNPQGVTAHWAKVWDDGGEDDKYKVLVLGGGKETKNVATVMSTYENKFINGECFSTNIWDNCEYIKETKKVPYGPGEMPDMCNKNIIHKSDKTKYPVLGHLKTGNFQICVSMSTLSNIIKNIDKDKLITIGHSEISTPPNCIYKEWYSNEYIFKNFEHEDGSPIGKDEEI